MGVRGKGRIRIGIDAGGTFTDFVVAVGHQLHLFKVPSTPQDPAGAVLDGLKWVRKTWAGADVEIVHGSTVATNALLQRTGARTALITTDGFQDVLEIGRQARPQLYNLMVDRPEPLVPRRRRFGAHERIGPTGDVLIALQPEDINRLVRAVRRARVESVAICLLFSFANPCHEQLLERALRPLGVPISASHRILPEYREYERTSTVVINAYVMPLVSRYLHRLSRGVSPLFAGDRSDRRSTKGKPPLQLRVMQSSGGSISARVAAREPVRTILSGPAGGVVGALRMAKRAATDRIISFDMGGTSTDVSLCDGRFQTTNEAQVAGLPVAIHIIDIHTVGAGGGSIAWMDAGGALRVGPESAGADPGPVCYGRGERITVTDANLILGRFGGRTLLGGGMKLDYDRAVIYMDRFAQIMSNVSGRPVSREQAALGILNVTNANMERALRKISIERGFDPRDFTLICFGGAGGLHVCALARALSIRRIIVPVSPGTLSALGMLLSDVQKEYSQTVMLPGDQFFSGKLEKVFRKIESKGARGLTAEGFSEETVRLERFCAVRYRGQSFELEVPWSRHLLRRFHEAHQRRYGYSDVSRPTEIVSVRVRCVARVNKPRMKPQPLPTDHVLKPKYESVVLKDSIHEVPVYPRESLPVGFQLSGPTIISEYSSTTFVPRGFTLHVDALQNLLIQEKQAST